jgi:transposase, IS30 family
MATWFCDAYASWQKGGVENANGRLRRWLTPRKCLGLKTPFQAILKELGKDAQIRFS